MGKRLMALGAALWAALALSGCASILERSYSSSVEHAEYTQAEDPSSLRAETYRGLVDAILYFINDHADRGVVRLYNYTGDVDGDLDAACREILREDPLAAFAVADISCEWSRIVSYYEVTVSPVYSHTAEEVNAIRYVSGASSLRQELYAAIGDFAPSLALRLSYYPGDAQSVRTMAVQAYYDSPQSAFGLPEMEISVYPDAGVQRIVEIDFHWPASRYLLSARSARLQSLARQLLDGAPPAGERYIPEELALLLRDNAAPIDPDGAGDPLSALSGEPANQLGHAMALELLCQLTGTEAVLVSGRTEAGSATWLIVGVEGEWRHLLLTDEEPRLYTDLELSALGYLWNAESYPACVDPNASLPAVEPDPAAGDGGAQTSPQPAG